MTRTVMITGASSGIGKATAALFANEGWNVIATMRDPSAFDGDTMGERLLALRLDVTDIASIEEAVAVGIGRFDNIDVLVNNAGYGAYGPLEATPLEEFRRQIDTNVFGMVACIKAVLPHFRARHSGRIVNVSSMGGRIAFPLGTPYHTSKFAVEGLSEALSYEMAAIGASVKLIEPGMVNTDFGGRSFAFTNDEAMTEYQELVGQTFTAFGSAQAGASPADDVASVILGASTDETDQFRYTVGDDARHLLRLLGTNEVIPTIRAMFRL